MKHLEWTDLRYFLVTARRGSATAAGRDLGASPATVTRRLHALEAALGARLFERARDGHGLTPAGRRLLAHAEAMEQAARAAEDAVRAADDEAVGTLRVACAEAVAHHVLLPRLAAIHAAHPRLRLELTVGPGTVSLGRREADVAVRLSRPERGDMVVRRLGRLAFAHYRVAGTVGPPPPPLVAWDAALAGVVPATLAGALSGAAPVTLDTATGHLIAARHGAGPCLLACIAGDRAADLERWPTGESIAGWADIWLAAHGAVADSPRYRAFRDLLAAALHAERAALAGRPNTKNEPENAI